MSKLKFLTIKQLKDFEKLLPSHIDALASKITQHLKNIEMPHFEEMRMVVQAIPTNKLEDFVQKMIRAYMLAMRTHSKVKGRDKALRSIIFERSWEEYCRSTATQTISTIAHLDNNPESFDTWQAWETCMCSLAEPPSIDYQVLFVIDIGYEVKLAMNSSCIQWGQLGTLTPPITEPTEAHQENDTFLDDNVDEYKMGGYSIFSVLDRTWEELQEMKSTVKPSNEHIQQLEDIRNVLRLFQMTKSEKKTGQLPKFICLMDQGGMRFPRQCFLPWLQLFRRQLGKIFKDMSIDDCAYVKAFRQINDNAEV
jgi:hypothetical protein